MFSVLYWGLNAGLVHIKQALFYEAKPQSSCYISSYFYIHLRFFHLMRLGLPTVTSLLITWGQLISGHLFQIWCNFFKHLLTCVKSMLSVCVRKCMSQEGKRLWRLEEGISCMELEVPEVESCQGRVCV